MLHSGEVVESLSAADFEVRAEIIWVKNRHVLSRGHYHPQHESCWYAVKKGGTGHWAGDRKQTTVWQIEHAKSDTGHGTQKPVEAMRRPVLNNSSPGHAVYEPFSGSGTTIIACESTGRCAHAIELDPVYVDVAVKRWAEFTGLDAVHEETGKTFAEMAEGRPFGT
jgi:DNA modification methylase